MVEAYSLLRKFAVGKILKGGRNNLGHLTIRGRSGGHKKKYIFLDFKRNLGGISGRIWEERNDFNRNSKIIKIVYNNGMVTWMLKPAGIKIGRIISVEGYGAQSLLNLGDSVFCNNIKKGFFLHNVELYPGRGGTLIRAGGTAGHVIRKVGINRVLLKLTSGLLRLSSEGCKATIGRVDLRREEKLRKAGRNRWLGRSPKVRGVAMNPVDHPHGGATSGGRCSVSSTGKFTKCGGNKVKNKYKYTLPRYLRKT
jgi:large subunit ribosomal protein L2